MSTTDASPATATERPGKTAVEMRLEVVVLPVADAGRSKEFYERLGWRLDADFVVSEDYRVIQFTPPGSTASIIFGTGVSAAEPGSVERVLLAVDDIDAARAELIAAGAEVSEVFHDAGGGLGGGFYPGDSGRASGPDPERRSYATYASFTDPDGNGFMLQELTTRLPGRVEAKDTSELAALLHETAEHHDGFEKASAPHDWWDWYASYFDARQNGATPQEADATADRYMADVHGVPASR